MPIFLYVVGAVLLLFGLPVELRGRVSLLGGHAHGVVGVRAGFLWKKAPVKAVVQWSPRIRLAARVGKRRWLFQLSDLRRFTRKPQTEKNRMTSALMKALVPIRVRADVSVGLSDAAKTAMLVGVLRQLAQPLQCSELRFMPEFATGGLSAEIDVILRLNGWTMLRGLLQTAKPREETVASARQKAA